MSTQFNLDFDRPRSRVSDPLSSHRAEQRMRDSGGLRGQAKVALELVKQFPGRSSKELAELGTLDRYQIARRLSDLLHAKKVYRIEPEGEDCKWYVK